MNIVAAIVLLACALLAAVSCIGAAMAYEENHRSVDGKGAYFCGLIAVVFAFIAGLLL